MSDCSMTRQCPAQQGLSPISTASQSMRVQQGCDVRHDAGEVVAFFQYDLMIRLLPLLRSLESLFISSARVEHRVKPLSQKGQHPAVFSHVGVMPVTTIVCVFL